MHAKLCPYRNNTATTLLTNVKPTRGFLIIIQILMHIGQNKNQFKLSQIRRQCKFRHFFKFNDIFILNSSGFISKTIIFIAHYVTSFGINRAVTRLPFGRCFVFSQLGSSTRAWHERMLNRRLLHWLPVLTASGTPSSESQFNFAR